MRPAALKAVVLNDIGPVVEGEGLAHIRSYLEGAPKPKTMAEAIAAQRAVHGAAFPALTEADWARFVAAIYRRRQRRPAAGFRSCAAEPDQGFRHRQAAARAMAAVRGAVRRSASGDPRRKLKASVGCDIGPKWPDATRIAKPSRSRDRATRRCLKRPGCRRRSHGFSSEPTPDPRTRDALHAGPLTLVLRQPRAARFSSTTTQELRSLVARWA